MKLENQCTLDPTPTIVGAMDPSTASLNPWIDEKSSTKPNRKKQQPNPIGKNNNVANSNHPWLDSCLQTSD
jgi:hypothetical protein